MNSTLLLMGLSNLLIGVASIGCAIPLVKRKIKMNRWYGIRIRKAFASQENWEKINEYGGRAMIRWSIPILVIGVGLIVISLGVPKIDMKNVGWVLVLAPFPAILLMGALLQILVWSKKLPG